MSATDITRDLIARLRVRYDGDRSGTVILFEVGDGAGFSNRGWSDAIAMQIWPSKGLEILGFEIKATRSDWLRELDRPEKNRTWQEFVDAWYVVAAKDVVKLEELPPDWGLMVPKGADSLRIASRPKTTERKKWNDPIPRDIVAAVFRAAGNERRWATRQARDDIRLQEAQRLGEEIETLRRQAREYEKKYEEIADALGHRWMNVGELKKRAELLRATEDEEPVRLVENARKRLEGALRRLEQAAKAIEGEG